MRPSSDQASADARADEQRQADSGELRPIVVAIGIEAVGGPALETFLSTISADIAAALVVIGGASAAGARAAIDAPCSGRLPMLDIGHGDPIVAGQVYRAPADRYLAVDAHRLLLVDPPDQVDARAPIDFFMRSLAAQHGPRCVGVMLSADGSDGCLGLRAIRDAAGLTMWVPRSSPDGGEEAPREEAEPADVCAQPGQLARRLNAHCQLAARSSSTALAGGQQEALERVLLLLRAHTGHDFSRYKKSSLSRRVERRINLHQLESLSEYVTYLRQNPRELGLLFKEMLIGVTQFFRDPTYWQALQQEVLPGLVARHAAGQPLRAWVARCSTGEEAYSLAIALFETFEQLGRRDERPLQVFATDLDPDAIERARAGWFPAGIAQDVTAERLQRFFTPERDGYRVIRAIRELVVFAPHNVFMDPPFTRLELLVCRNLLIYLEADLQGKLLPLFHFCLNPEGVLFLGSAETVGRHSRFTPLDAKARLYRRDAVAGRSSELEFPARLQRRLAPELPRSETPNLQQYAEQVLLQRFAPAAVLVNGQGDILYINGRTGRYLEPAAGRANWNVYAMARSQLGQELALALPRALRDKGRVDCPGIEIQGDAGPVCIDLCVYGIEHPDALAGMAMVMFLEPRAGASAAPADDTVPLPRDIQAELQLARETLRTTRDEMQSQHEELRSANEELQSTNEEVQSANEELTTSKEEMQSLNEELQAVNAELQSRLFELSRAHSDIDNLLNATEFAVVFLDAGLQVRRFTGRAAGLFNLVSADIGRRLSNIVNRLEYPDLHRDASEVLRTLVVSDKKVNADDQHRYRVRISPYRSREQVIDGVLITVTDLGHSRPSSPRGRNDEAAR